MSQLDTTRAEHPSQRPPVRSRTCLVNLLLVFGAILLLLGLVTGAVYWRIHLYHQQALHDVQAELDRIRTAGEPITPEDMQQYHQDGPRSAEKALLWLEAIRALPDADAVPEEEAALLKGMGSDPALPISDEEVAIAERVLSERSEVITRAADAAEIDGDERFPIQFERGIAAEIKHTGELLRLARLYAVQHRVAIAHREEAKAIASLNMILATAEALEFEPQLISQLIRMAILRTYCRELVLTLESSELTDEQLAEIQNRTDRIDLQQGFRRGLIGERASGYHAFHYMTDNLDQLMGEGEFSDGTLRRPADFRYYLEVMRNLLIATESELPEARVLAMRVDVAVKQTLRSEARAKRRELTVSTLLLPSPFVSFDSWAKAEAVRRSAIAAIALRRYQLARRQPPESLAALCPEFLAAVPQDPFAESPTPLKLVVTDDRFAIYSVGANLADDRGLLADAEKVDDPGVVVRLALPLGPSETESVPMK